MIIKEVIKWLRGKENNLMKKIFKDIARKKGLILLVVMVISVGKVFAYRRNYTTADGLANNYVRSIAIDSAGNKWFGTYGGNCLSNKSKSKKEVIKMEFNVSVLERTELPHIRVTDVNFLVNEGKAKVLSKPRIITLTNQQATISNTTAVPYTFDSSQNENSSNFGITLTVTPYVYSGNLINLSISTDLSDLAGWSNKSQPITYSRRFTNNINLVSGESFVMGGLEKTVIVNTDKGLPLLRNIIPGLFSRIIKSELKNQILVFITASIVPPDLRISPKDLESLKEIEGRNK